MYVCIKPVLCSGVGLVELGWSVCRGEAINGGFGLVLDGSDDAERRAKSVLSWDVNNGVIPHSLDALEKKHMVPIVNFQFFLP